mmetsp:Transcript_25257/g.100634  ORF Transcript_25257/g.100634 Transcript_25257/m.100634 type:complete len:201 (+) Transcript_25257:433-1035(+)
MGPSGAGKSTLLNTLSGRVNGAVATLARGRVTANGVPIATTSDFAKFGTVAPQDDVLLPALTTFELLDFAAKLRGSTPGRVEALLTAFELAERRDLASASLSGGQRKRLSIAMEVVHSPAVLLVDEPTSGLDAPRRGHPGRHGAQDQDHRRRDDPPVRASARRRSSVCGVDPAIHHECGLSTSVRRPRSRRSSCSSGCSS